MKLNETEYNLLVSLLDKIAGQELFVNDIANIITLTRAAGWSETTSAKVEEWADQIRFSYKMLEEPTQ